MTTGKLLFVDDAAQSASDQRKNSNTAATNNMTSDLVVSEHDKSFQSPGEQHSSNIGDLAEQGAPTGFKHTLRDRRESKKQPPNKSCSAHALKMTAQASGYFCAASESPEKEDLQTISAQMSQADDFSSCSDLMKN